MKAKLKLVENYILCMHTNNAIKWIWVQANSLVHNQINQPSFQVNNTKSSLKMKSTPVVKYNFKNMKNQNKLKIVQNRCRKQVPQFDTLSKANVCTL